MADRAKSEFCSRINYAKKNIEYVSSCTSKTAMRDAVFNFNTKTAIYNHSNNYIGRVSYFLIFLSQTSQKQTQIFDLTNKHY